MTLNEAAGKCATVTVADRVFQLSPITLRAGQRLWQVFESIARRTDGERTAAAYRVAAAAPTPEMQAEAVREIIREVKRGDPLSDHQIAVARRSPDGVIEELFAYTRDTHPDVTKGDLTAIINATNAAEVFEQLIEATAGMDPKDATRSV